MLKNYGRYARFFLAKIAKNIKLLYINNLAFLKKNICKK